VSAHGSEPRDPFLDELAVELAPSSAENSAEDIAGAALLRLCEALPEVAPSAVLRARLLDSAQAARRFDRFASKVAQLLDLGIDRSKALLARLGDASVWTEELPGIRFFWVEGGPAVSAAVRGFVWIEAGREFPEHEHLGDETTLVLQGAFEDPARDRVFRPGDIDRMPPGTSHAFRALPGGPDLVKLAVVQKGLRALGHTYLPR
jgi:quercetin dioxygenase-like cupin family protein